MTANAAAKASNTDKIYTTLREALKGYEFKCIKEGNFNPSSIISEILEQPMVDREVLAGYMDYSVSHLSKVRSERTELRGVITEKYIEKLAHLTDIPLLPMLIANCAKRLDPSLTESLIDQFKCVYGYSSPLTIDEVAGVEESQALRLRISDRQDTGNGPEIRVFEDVRIKDIKAFNEATPEDRLAMLVSGSISRKVSCSLITPKKDCIYIRHFGEGMVRTSHSRGSIPDGAIVEIQLTGDMLIGDAESQLTVHSGDTVYAQLPDMTANCFVYDRDYADDDSVYEVYRSINNNITPTARPVYVEPGSKEKLEDLRLVLGKVNRVVHSAVSDGVNF